MKWYGKYGRKASRIVIRNGQYGRKASWIVIRYEQYGRMVSWIVIRYGKYGRKQVEEWKDMKNIEETKVE